MGRELERKKLTDPIVYGADYSVYTRIACLTLAEKRIPYTLEPIDVFAENGLSEDYLKRQPFGKIPSFEHDGFELYETSAITRYIDEMFDGPDLMPEDLKSWSRANQIISILDNYAYRSMVWDVFVERVRVPQKGGTSDEKKIAAGLKLAEKCLGEIESLMEDGSYFMGNFPGLADLYAAPIIALFRQCEEGNELLLKSVRWIEWWNRINDRPSMISTRSPLETLD
jgi:glutathione S-transferase